MAALPETESSTDAATDAANGGSSIEHKKWHEIWNPLNLDEVEPQRDSYLWSEEGNIWFILPLCLYFMSCSAGSIIGPMIPLFVLLGDPSGKFDENIFYWIILAMLIFFVLFLTIRDFQRMLDNKSLSFFKVTLHVESKREHRLFVKLACLVMGVITFYIFALSYDYSTFVACEKLYYSQFDGKNISIYDCSWADYNQKKCTFYYTLPIGVNTSFPYECYKTPGLNASPETPTFPSPSFFILFFTFLKSVYDFYTYNEIFADFMLPKAKLVKTHFPLVHKFAAQNMPTRTPFDAERFEPNIPIRPTGGIDFQNFNWRYIFMIFTDSQAVLKNVVVACSRVHAYVHRYPMTEKRWTISQLCEHVDKRSKQGFDNPAMQDDSIAWECANSIF